MSRSAADLEVQNSGASWREVFLKPLLGQGSAWPSTRWRRIAQPLNGSPAGVRTGRPVGRGGSVGDPALIPAGAGQTARPLQVAAVPEAHPRARGDEPTVRGLRQRSGTCAPLERGTQDPHGDWIDSRRLIPARAGHTLDCQGFNLAQQVQPISHHYRRLAAGVTASVSEASGRRSSAHLRPCGRGAREPTGVDPLAPLTRDFCTMGGPNGDPETAPELADTPPHSRHPRT